MQFRDHPGVQGKRDAYPFDPRMLKIDCGYNIRDLDNAEERAELDELKEQIRSNGVRTPLEVRLRDEDVFIVAGHRRHKVVLELIEEGEDIKTVPVMPEPKGTNEADRIVNLVVSNSGKPLKPLQVAEVVRRLVAFGWDKTQIAQRLGWKSNGSVNQYLDMLAMPEAVKEQVRQGDVSATLARKVVRDAKDDPEFAAELIRKNKEENARIRGDGKRTKVTAKTLKRDKPKTPAAALPPSQQPAASVTLPPASVPQSQPSDDRTEAETVSADALIQTEGTQVNGPDDVDALAREGTPRSMTDAELDQGLRDAGYLTTQPYAALIETTRAKVEQQNGWHPDAVPDPLSGVDTAPTRAGVKELISALEPFANIAHDIDFNERGDDEVTEVPIKHLKQAWVVFARVCGEQG